MHLGLLAARLLQTRDKWRMLPLTQTTRSSYCIGLAQAQHCHPPPPGSCCCCPPPAFLALCATAEQNGLFGTSHGVLGLSCSLNFEEQHCARLPCMALLPSNLTP